MTVESESDDGLELEDCRGCSSDNMSAQPEMEISDVDKENLNHFPMEQRIPWQRFQTLSSTCIKKKHDGFRVRIKLLAQREYHREAGWGLCA